MAIQSADRDFRIGRVLTRSTSILFRHFLIFVLAGAAASLPAVLLTRLLGFEQSLTLSQSFDLSLPALAEVFVYALLAYLYFTVYDAAVITPAAFQARRLRPVGFGNALSIGLARVIPVVLLEIITILLVALAMLGLIVPGLVLMTMWFVGVPACVVERAGPWTSLRRSAQLTKGHRWKVFGLILFLGIVGEIAQALLEFMPMGDLLFGLFRAVWLPYWSIVVVMTYYDLRVTHEGVQQVEAID